jgi:hypothetical protein
MRFRLQMPAEYKTEVMDQKLTLAAVGQIWAIMIPFDNRHTMMDGAKSRKLHQALEDMAKGLEGADQGILHTAEQIRTALNGGVLGVPEGNANRESILKLCELLRRQLG